MHLSRLDCNGLLKTTYPGQFEKTLTPPNFYCKHFLMTKKWFLAILTPPTDPPTDPTDPGQ